jgi:hypothetical protein
MLVRWNSRRGMYPSENVPHLTASFALIGRASYGNGLCRVRHLSGHLTSVASYHVPMLSASFFTETRVVALHMALRCFDRTCAFAVVIIGRLPDWTQPSNTSAVDALIVSLTGLVWSTLLSHGKQLLNEWWRCDYNRNEARCQKAGGQNHGRRCPRNVLSLDHDRFPLT